jgi:hypothetical protein
MMPKSIDQLMEEEERYEAQTRAQSAKHALEREKMLMQLEKRRGKQEWKMYSSDGTKSGIDWQFLRGSVG